MKKVLFVAHVVKRHFMLFHIPYVKWFKENGYETHVCANNDYENKAECKIPYCDKYYDLPFQRSPFSLKNISAYRQLKEIIENNDYKLIHCHTPVGGVLTRLAARKIRKDGTKVVYTAHGFHFFKGAPLINWILFYPVEKFCARYTDVLITMNQEDFEIAQKFKAGRVKYVPGVGVDTTKFNKIAVDSTLKRRELGVPEDSFIILSTGELSKRKNHEVIIRALSKLKNKKIVYLICGQGLLENYLEGLAANLGVNIKLLGFRRDVAEILSIANLFVFPSLQEGLPVGLMEAMSSGLPVVCSKIRGNIDLIEEGKGGCLIRPDDISGFTNAIGNLVGNFDDRKKFGIFNKEAVKKYDIQNVNKIMCEIYNSI